MSRSPVRNALRVLQAEGIVAAPGHGGYAVLKPLGDVPPRPQPPAGGDDEAYARIVEDRLSGALADRFTETNWPGATA